MPTPARKRLSAMDEKIAEDLANCRLGQEAVAREEAQYYPMQLFHKELKVKCGDLLTLMNARTNDMLAAPSNEKVAEVNATAYAFLKTKMLERLTDETHPFLKIRFAGNPQTPNVGEAWLWNILTGKGFEASATSGQTFVGLALDNDPSDKGKRAVSMNVYPRWAYAQAVGELYGGWSGDSSKWTRRKVLETIGGVVLGGAAGHVMTTMDQRAGTSVRPWMDPQQELLEQTGLGAAMGGYLGYMFADVENKKDKKAALEKLFKDYGPALTSDFQCAVADINAIGQRAKELYDVKEKTRLSRSGG